MLKKQTEKYHLQWYHSEHLLRHHGMQKNVKFQVNDKIINLEISRTYYKHFLEKTVRHEGILFIYSFFHIFTTLVHIYFVLGIGL